MTGPLGETAGKNGRPELPAVQPLTVVDFERELRRRGVLGVHFSLVGTRVAVTVVTSDTDDLVSAPDLEIAFRRLLSRLEVTR